MPVITLTTDFGLDDWFVGTMKGVILDIAPAAQVVDITHTVPPGDVRGAAFALRSSYAFFPKGTIHVAVVDPGVGSKRNAIAIETADYFFVGPDNGVLSLAIAREKVRRISRLENKRFFLQQVSNTFHGRDVFAPVAAQLANGVRVRSFGLAARDFVRLQLPAATVTGGTIEGEVAYVDRFGNAITNICMEDISSLEGRTGIVRVGASRIPLGQYYQQVARGNAIAVLGSSGFLEIAVNGGSAARTLKLRIGTRLRIVNLPVKSSRAARI